MEGPKAPKKRRLGDKSLPNSLTNNPSFAADSKMYTDLLEMERKLDWQMMRKKAEIQDTLGRPPTATRTLRLFLSHTVVNQSWQTGAPSGFDGTNVNLETGEGIPAWQLKIEGRLLELPNQRAKDRPVAKKFSSFIKKIFIELVRDHTLYPDGNTAELHPVASGHELDGYTLRRTGDTLTELKILIQLEQTPEIHKVVEPLASILGVNHETRTGLVQALWSYVKINQLQDKIDRRMVRADDALRPIFGNDAIPFQQLGEICLRFIAPADPIVLNYTIDPSQVPPEKPQAWDIEVRMEDVVARSKMNAVLVNMSPEGSAELTKLDEEIMQHAQSIQNAQTKLTFLRSFAADPAGFIDTWLASQSRDLDALLGGSEAAVIGPSGHGGLAEDTGNVRRVRAEELKRSEFFRLPWVEEAIALQEGMRLARMAQ